MPDYILKATDLSKSYEVTEGKITRALKGVSLEVNRGEFLSITGPSGAGKSTMLHLLASFDKPDRGSIKLSVDGDLIDYSKIAEEELNSLRNKRIGFVFQFYRLLPEFTAIENVMTPALIGGKGFNEASDKALELMKVVGIEKQKDQKPTQLSGGEQQRTAIARALINEPDIVFADEPTGNLDKKNEDIILNLIEKLSSELNKTFIIATHSPYVSSIAEREVKITDGKLVSD